MEDHSVHSLIFQQQAPSGLGRERSTAMSKDTLTITDNRNGK
ncbi:MAG: hypothetical protein HW409_1036, partial [candidate division NC10 bacterium]|nr:hypothetical protein [candidate division NC10 bacterium]